MYFGWGSAQLLYHFNLFFRSGFLIFFHRRYQITPLMMKIEFCKEWTQMTQSRSLSKNIIQKIFYIFFFFSFFIFSIYKWTVRIFLLLMLNMLFFSIFFFFFFFCWWDVGKQVAGSTCCWINWSFASFGSDLLAEEEESSVDCEALSAQVKCLSCNKFANIRINPFCPSRLAKKKLAADPLIYIICTSMTLVFCCFFFVFFY